MVLRFQLLLATGLLVIGSTTRAQQVEPSSELAAYLRLLELEGRATGSPLVYHSASLVPHPQGLHADTAGAPWAARIDLTPRDASSSPLEVLSSSLVVTYNTAFPRTANDGPLWAGRGAAGIARAGIGASVGGLTVRFAPAVVYAQNRAFALARGPQNGPSTPYVYPWHSGIDFPQRFGDSHLLFIDPGESAIRYDYRVFTFGVSTESVWLGPAFRNPILMGNTAPGFPHLDLGTGRELRTSIGAFEARIAWGILSRSRFAAPSNTGGRRMLGALTVGYRPSFLPGLTLGAARVLYHPWPANLGVSDFTDVFGVLFNAGTVLPNGGVINDSRDQMASLTARWVFPAAGFEAYVEWARGDFAGSLKDLLLEPDHSQAFTAGFQKSLRSGDGRMLLRGEITSLAKPNTFLLRDEPTFYTHHINVEGYANRGQLLGAAIGPGSNAQFLGLDRYSRWGRVGLFLERIRYDDDYVFTVLRGTPFAYLRHQVDLTFGASLLRFSGSFDLEARLELTRELNRYFVRDNDQTNAKLTFAVRRPAR